jgi:porin
MRSLFSVFGRRACSTLAMLLLATPAAAQEQDASTQEQPERLVGSPNQVDNTIFLDLFGSGFLTEWAFLEPWNDWKTKLREDHGISFGLDYSSVWLSGSNPLPGAAREGAGGMVRFYGSWELVGRGSDNAGAFVWKVENRHGYADTPPVGLASNLGYVGLFEPPFSDQQNRWTNIYWRQRIAGRATVFVGFLDATDYVDVYALASPWTGFTNFAFSTGTQTIAVPNDAAFGVAAGVMVTDNIFAIGGIVDSNSDPTKPLDGFNSFFERHEYFKSIEVGYTSGNDMIYLDNVHVTFWHQDERVEAASPSGWGFNLSATKYLGGRWLPFLRLGYAEDGGSLMQKSVAAGFGYQPVPGGHLLGVGLNWGQPNESTWGSSDLDDQFTLETFGRVMIAKELTLTPTLQWILNPALNPDVSSTVVFGVRARLAL